MSNGSEKSRPVDRSLIGVVDPESPPEGSEKTLHRVREMAGGLSNLHLTAAQSPAALRGLWHQMESGPHWTLSERRQLLISLRVSQVNCCSYCLAAYTAKARTIGLPEEEIREIRMGRSGDSGEQALLDLVGRIVEHRGHHVGFEVAAARAAGFTDGEIVEMIWLVGMVTTSNYLDCVANTEIDFPLAEDLGLCQSY